MLAAEPLSACLLFYWFESKKLTEDVWTDRLAKHILQPAVEIIKTRGYSGPLSMIYTWVTTWSGICPCSGQVMDAGLTFMGMKESTIHKTWNGARIGDDPELAQSRLVITV